MELILHLGDRLVGDHLVKHHRQTWIAARHFVERFETRTRVLEIREDVLARFPFKVQPDYLDRFFKAQILKNLNIEEIVERLFDTSDYVKVQRSCGDKQASVVCHKKLAQRGKIILVANLPREQLAKVLKHDQDCPIALAILSADCGY